MYVFVVFCYAFDRVVVVVIVDGLMFSCVFLNGK